MAGVKVDAAKIEVLETSMEVCDGPPLKKFKQVRLPFKPLDHTSQIQTTSPVSKKRKLSDNDSPSAKQMKTGASKPTSTPVKVECDPEVSSSSEADSNKQPGSHKKASRKTNTLDSFLKAPKTNKDEQEEISSTMDCIDLTDDKAGENEDKLEDTKPDNNQLPAAESVSCDNTKEDDNKLEKVDEEGDKDRTASVDENDDKENQDESKCLDQSFISDISVCEDALKTPAKVKNDVQTQKELKDRESCSTDDKRDVNSDGANTPNTASKQTKTPGSTARKTKLSESKKKEKEEQRLRREKEIEEKRVQKQKEKEEKERVKSEKKKQKEQEKVEKEKAKQEEKEKKEQERIEKLKQKEEEKRQKEKENEAKMEAKLEEKKKKEEEKRQKEEEKRLKEEEKKQKEVEKKKEEEEKLKKEEKKKESFKKFFIQKPPTMSPPKVSENNKNGIFMPFEVKPNMRLAPVHRVCLEEEQKSSLDGLMEKQDHEDTYMQSVKTNNFTARTSSKTWPRDLNEDKDVELLSHDLDVIEKVTHRAKFLYFHENTRPPYYGTWRKTSNKLSSRNPFRQDEELFDYEVDSDDEWEEEEPGESVSSDENEDDDKDKEEDDEDADGWMVPHGYLSDGEGAEDEEEVDNASKQDLQKIRQAAWESELKRQAKPLRMVAIGCCWSGDSTSNIAAQQLEMLLKFKAVSLVHGSVPTTYSGASMTSGTDKLDKKDEKSGKYTPKNIKPVPEEAMPDLIQLVHGNVLGIKNLMKEFRTYWKQKTDPSTPLDDTANTSQLETSAMETDEKPDQGEAETPKAADSKTESEDDFSISKRQLFLKIQAMAVREKRPEYKKQCWYVNKDVLKQYNMEDISIPNTWKYVCVKEPKWAADKEKEKDKLETPANTANNTTTPGSSTPSGRATPTIMQFAQPMSLSKIQALGMTPVNKEIIKGASADVKDASDPVVDDINNVEIKVEPSLPSDQKTIKDMFSSQGNKKKAEKVMLSPTSTKLAAQKKVLCKQGSPRVAIQKMVTPKKEDKDDIILIEEDQPAIDVVQPISSMPTTPRSCGGKILESIMTSPELMKASPDMTKQNVDNKGEIDDQILESMDVDDVIVLD